VSAWTARSQAFSLVLTLLWAEALRRYWRTGDARLLWLFPLSMVLWVNLHAGFIAGLATLGTAAALALLPAARGRADPRRLWLSVGATLLATLLNPWGPALLAHIYADLHIPAVQQYAQEFQSPNFHEGNAQLFMLAGFAVVAVWLWQGHLARTRATAGTPAPQEVPAVAEPLGLALVAVWTALALDSVRFIPFWALVAVPYLGESLTSCLRATLGSEVLARRPRIMGTLARARRLEAADRLVGHGLWAALVVAAVALLVANGGALPGARRPILAARFDAQVFPVAAAARLHVEGIPAGRGFTTYNWGSYLDLALPEYHPFIDSRADAYPPQLVTDYLDIMGLAPDWQQLLVHYQVRWALLPADEPLGQALPLVGWRCQPEDNQGVALLCVAPASWPPGK
jgi:hypothetical protein